MLTLKSLSPTRSMSGLWPTEEQELLIKAATLPRIEALEAFWLWRECIGEPPAHESQSAAVLNDIDHSTLRLLPLLHHQLQSFHINDTLTARIADVYLDSWLLLNRNLSFVLPLLRLLNEKAIDTLLLKGAPIAYEYYPLPATRPMADFDVLIRPSDIRNAIDVLAEAGWNPTRELIADDFRFRHAQSFINTQGVEFDFHWHVMPACCDELVDNEFWQRSLSFELEGVATRRLDATDCLLHTLIHGVHTFAWNAEPAIRWIPDSMLLLRQDAQKIDWDRIVFFAIDYKLTHRLALALGYLHNNMGVDVPQNAMQRLEAHPVSFLEKLEHRPRKMINVKISENSSFTPKTSLIDKLVQFLRYKNGSEKQNSNQSDGKDGFLAFLVYKHRAQSKREVVFYYARRLTLIFRKILVKRPKDLKT